VERRAPHARPPGDLTGAEAFSVVAGLGLGPVRPVAGALVLPPEGAALRRNPLYQAGEIAWPSDRYAREYGPRATYPTRATCPENAMAGASTAEWAIRRELLDLPERW
jgi:hypothetical protein